MEIKTPASLKSEHEELHNYLHKATREPNKTGVAAKNVAKIMHSHFIKEEEYAAPPLSLLNELSKGKITKDMEPVLELTQKLEDDLPNMLEEHKQIVAALDKLKLAATEENKTEYIEFAEKLKLHAQTEEEVMYPAAILVGKYLKFRLGL
jgi:hypothetical protein